MLLRKLTGLEVIIRCWAGLFGTGPSQRSLIDVINLKWLYATLHVYRVTSDKLWSPVCLLCPSPVWCRAHLCSSYQIIEMSWPCLCSWTATFSADQCRKAGPLGLVIGLCPRAYVVSLAWQCTRGFLAGRWGTWNVSQVISVQIMLK